MSRLRRYGFLATIAIGMALLAASLHGMASVDQELKIAAATPAPVPAAAPELVRDEGRGRDCDKPRRGRHHPEV